MDDKAAERVKRPPNLASAIRAARLEEAERSQVLGDLRGAEVARLDLLREAIEPVLAQIPVEVDMFDMGVVPGERPRLFVDMISFVEMDRDRRTYRFLHDTRHGRMVLAENDGIAAMADAITRYIARRLVEREKTLASLLDAIVPAPPERPRAAAPKPFERLAFTMPSPNGPVVRLLRLGVDGLGVLTLAGLVWLGMHYVHGRFPVW